jgi:hypothetical protein
MEDKPRTGSSGDERAASTPRPTSRHGRQRQGHRDAVWHSSAVVAWDSDREIDVSSRMLDAPIVLARADRAGSKRFNLLLCIGYNNLTNPACSK